MKDLKLFAVIALGVLGMAFAASNSDAAWRGAKPTQAYVYSTALVGISSAPTTLYSVILGTGAASEYVALFDTNSIVGITTAGTTKLKARVFYANTASNTVVNFDPPLIFNNGLIVGGSAATGAALFSYGRGINTQGY